MSEKWEHVQTWNTYVDFERDIVQLKDDTLFVMRITLDTASRRAWITVLKFGEADSDDDTAEFSTGWQAAITEVGVTEQWVLDQVQEKVKS